MRALRRPPAGAPMTHRISNGVPRRARAAVVALLVLAGVGAGCTQVSVPERTEIEGGVVEAPLRKGSDGLYAVELGFADGVRRRAVVDSGSGLLLLRAEDADALGLDDRGSILLHGSDRSALTTMRSGVLGEVRLDGDAGAARFFDVEAFSLEGTALPILVGATLFDAGLLTLDFARERLRFEPGELPEADGATILDYEDVGGVPAIDVVVGDVRLRAVVDSGFNGGLGVSESDAAGLRAVLSAKPAEFFSVHGTKSNRFGRLVDPLRFGAHTVGNASLTVGLNDTLLGLQVLRRFVVTFDRRNQRVRFALPPENASRPAAGSRRS
jgi:hypothetical protein